MKIQFCSKVTLRVFGLGLCFYFFLQYESVAQKSKNQEFDVVVLVATPRGIALAVAAFRMELKVALVKRSKHSGGLRAYRLGATDVHIRDLSSGFFCKEFVDDIVSENDLSLWAGETGFSYSGVSKLGKNMTGREGLLSLWLSWKDAFALRKD